jgi:hypothetical protein
MHFENREHWLATLPFKENATRCSRDMPSLNTPRDYHGNPRAHYLDAFWLVTDRLHLISGSDFIGNDWQVGTIIATFAKIVPNKLTKKTVFTQISIRNLGLKIICPKLFDTYWDFESDKFTAGKWFCKNVAEWCGDLVPEISEERSKRWIDIAGPSDCHFPISLSGICHVSIRNTIQLK